MQSSQFSSYAPFYPSIDVDEEDHAQRIALATQMIFYLDVAIAARAYSNALDARYGFEVFESTVRDESRDLLQRFVAGDTNLGMSTQELKQKLDTFKQDAKVEARYAKRLRMWTRLFEIVFGKENFKNALETCNDSLPSTVIAPILLGGSLAFAAICLTKSF